MCDVLISSLLVFIFHIYCSGLLAVYKWNQSLFHENIYNLAVRAHVRVTRSWELDPFSTHFLLWTNSFVFNLRCHATHTIDPLWQSTLVGGLLKRPPMAKLFKLSGFLGFLFKRIKKNLKLFPKVWDFSW